MTDVRSTLHFDDGKMVEQRQQDVAPTLERAARLRSIGETGTSEMRHAARFPKVVVENYCARHGITLHEWMIDPVHVGRMLNDPDLAAFRIWEGKA